MKNISKGMDIGQVFPIYAVENDFIISKAAEITAVYRVELPEIFTISGEEYEQMHQTWLKAFKVLPDYSVVLKQDWYTESLYKPQESAEEKSFLSESFDRHFYERPFLDHVCYLYITKSRKGRSRVESIDSMLLRGRILPVDTDPETLKKFSEAVSQAENIINDCGLMKISRLGADEIIGTKKNPGILEKYMCLSQKDEINPLEDFIFDKGDLIIGNKHVCIGCIASSESLPREVRTGKKYDALSTEVTDCTLSFVSPVGLLLGREHILNQYIFLDNSADNIRHLESACRRMVSFERLSSNNITNSDNIADYISLVNTEGYQSVRSHTNVIAWSQDRKELDKIRTEINTAFTALGCEKVRFNKTDAPVLFWAGIPGNAGDFPREESYTTFLENAVCLFAGETSYHDSLSPFGIKMTDRLSGRPVHVDLSEIWMKKGLIHNRNKFVLGGSGGGKSFFMNHVMRQYYEQGAHIILVDMGDSYEGLCNLINTKTKGKDGIYFNYTEEKPIAFNPFYTDDGVYGIEKRESLKTLIMTLWKRDNDRTEASEDVTVENALREYLDLVKEGKVIPSFNTFYEFVRDEFNVAGDLSDLLEKEGGKVEKLFDVVNFLHVLKPFYRGGTYDYLLNSDRQLDLLSKRFIVFELDNIRDHKILFPVVTLMVMEAYMNKLRHIPNSLKVLVLEEAWKAIAKEGMAEYIKYCYKTVRKHFGEITVVTQDMDDIISSDIIKEAIINNADFKALLYQGKELRKFERIQKMLGLTDKDKEQILSINRDLNPARGIYREVWFGFGTAHSAVYATEVSREEQLCYSTEKTEKTRLVERTKILSGNIEQAIRELVGEEKN